MESFGEWVRQRRRALGVTQGELARRVGVAEVTIRKIEADERRPSAQIAELLADQLGLALADRARFLLAARALRGAEEQPARAAEAGAPPLPTTPLVGREADLAAAAAALERPEARLLTLSGPPGIGKTRLAIQLAHSLGGQLGRPTFVALAPIGDPELVAAAICQALGTTPGPGETARQRLHSALQGRHLLILDNFEQLLPAAELLAELLAVSADLKLIVTSRAALRLLAEHEYPVRPLPVAAAPGAALAEIEASPAVQLFVQRARAVRRDFRLSAANAPAVAAICDRLDGLPLAIELAAARIRLHSPQELLARLDHRLALLTGGPADLPQRQRTLRGAIAWSYQLLSPAEQRLLAWLGAFVGGWALEDLEAIAPPGEEVAGALGALLDHSLVQAREQGGRLRFSLLETVREYALERLGEGGELEQARLAHARHYLGLAAATGALMTTAGRAAALERAEAERDNIGAALDWAITGGRAGLALDLAAAIAWLWIERRQLSEGRAWMGRIMALPAIQAERIWRGRALAIMSRLASRQGDYAVSMEMAREALAIFERQGERGELAEIQQQLAWLESERGELEAAMELTEEAVAIWRELGDLARLADAIGFRAWVQQRLADYAGSRASLEEGLALLRGGEHGALVAELLWSLADTAHLEGQAEEARRRYAESLDLLRAIYSERELPDLLHIRAWRAYQDGDYAQAAALFGENAALTRERGQLMKAIWATNHAGDALRCLGDYAGAAARYAECLGLFRAEGHRQGEAAMLHNLGYVARQRGDLAEAEGLFRASLELFVAVGYTWSIADAVAGLAGVAAARGEAELAARLLGAVDAAQSALDASGALREPANKLEWAVSRAAIGARLAPEAARAAYAAGRALSLEEAVALAGGGDARGAG